MREVNMREVTKARLNQFLKLILSSIGVLIFMLGVYKFAFFVFKQPDFKYLIRYDSGIGIYSDTYKKLDHECILVDGMFYGETTTHCGKYWVFDGKDTEKLIDSYDQ